MEFVPTLGGTVGKSSVGPDTRKVEIVRSICLRSIMGNRSSSVVPINNVHDSTD